MKIYGRELVIANQIFDAYEEWRLIPGESLHIIQDLFDNSLVLKRDPICKQFPKVNMKAFAGSMSAAEAFIVNQSHECYIMCE